MNTSVKTRGRNRSNSKFDLIKDLFELKDTTIYESIIALMVSLFIIIMPFFRGLYFRENYIPAIAIISLIFAIYSISRLLVKGSGLIRNWLDVMLLIYPVSYAISFFFSVNAKDSLDAILRYSACFMLYKLISDLSKNRCLRNIFINVLLFSTSVVAITGLISAMGIWNFKGAFMGDRLSGLYQYPNTTAAVLGAGIFLGLGLLIRSSKILAGVYYQLNIVVLFSAFILTLSRGSYLIFGLLIAVYFVLVNMKNKFDMIFNLVIMSISCAPFIVAFYRLKHSTMIFLLLSLTIAAGLQFIYRKYIKEKIYLISPKAGYIIFGLLIACVIVSGIWLLAIENLTVDVQKEANYTLQMVNPDPDTAYRFYYEAANGEENNDAGIIITSIDEKGLQTEIYRDFDQSVGVKDGYDFSTLNDTKIIYITIYNLSKDNTLSISGMKILDNGGSLVREFKRFKNLPSAIGERLSDFSLDSSNNDARLVFAKDGIKLFKDYFLFGAGGGAWQNLYTQYQSYPYSTRETHNHYIQMLTEIGMLGIIALILTSGILIKYALSILLKEKDYFEISLLLPAAMIFMHAAIDFDLSLMAVIFLAFALLAIISSNMPSFNGVPKNINSYGKVGLTIAAILVTFTGTTIFMGIISGNNASRIINSDVLKAEKLYKKAIGYDKYNAAYKIDYAQILDRRYQSSRSQSDLVLLNDNLKAATKYEPYNTRYTPTIINLLLKYGRFEEASSKADNLIALQPLSVDAYSFKVDVNYQVASYFFKNKKFADAIPYLDKMLQTRSQIEAAKEKSSRQLIIPEKLEKMFKIAEQWKKAAEKKK